MDPPADLSGGNVEAGKTLFNTSCTVCHGDDGVGTGIGPRVAGIGLTPEYIGRRVRLSGRSDSSVYAGLLGGIMPFWSADRLSDDQLRDIVAYLTDESTTAPTDPDPGPGDNPTPGQGNCGTDHPMVGQTANLTTRFHDVAGTATVIDNCTIQIDQFSYDGEGIIVEIYGGTQGNYNRPVGFPITGDIVGRRFNNETYLVPLPSHVSLDDFDGISVWCSAVGVSFGDGQFGG